jgi:glycerophosphoryl diester phosphodiesterase
VAAQDRPGRAETSPIGQDGVPVRPITFAHRGARTERPENTIDAFRRALELGATGLETDAWLAADGEVVLVHDAVIRRGWRRIRIGRTSSAELAEVGVPRLRELYETLGHDYELSIDVQERGAARPIIAIARSVAEDALRRLWLCSPSRSLLEDVRQEVPDVRLVHSTSRRRIDVPLERHAAQLGALHVDAMNFHNSEWTAGLVALFHRFEVKAFAWDTQEVRELRNMLRCDVDAVYCDRVDRMVAAVRDWDDAATGS